MTELLYSTADLSSMMRVGKSTIKRWTDEGKLKCFRTPGGHRKFKASAVEKFVEEYQYEVSQSFKDRAGLGNHGLDEISTETTIELCFLYAIKNNHLFIEQHFKSSFLRSKNLAQLLDIHLTPLLQYTISAFRKNKISSVEFQIAKNTLMHALINVVDSVPRKPKNNIELYCLSVNEGINEVELKAVELLLEQIGCTVYNLGTVLTKYAAQDIVSQCKPDDVFVVLSLDHSSDEIINQFNALVSGVTSYGGSVYTSNFFEKENSPIQFPTASKKIHSFSEIVERFSRIEETDLTVNLKEFVNPKKEIVK